MTKEKTERQSNIEVLRILAMFMIVLGHAWYHYERGLPDYPIKGFCYHIINPLLYMHVDIFVLITGYFGLKCRIRTFYKFYSICLFYILFSLAFSLLFPQFGSFHLKALVFPLTRTDWWFITVYLTLMLVSPVINAVIALCDSRRKWVYLIGISFIFNFYLSWFHKIDSVYSMGFDLFNFSCLYILGRYIAINGIPFKIRTLFISFAALCVLKILLSEFSLINESFDKFIKIKTYCNPINVFSAFAVLCLFLMWRKGWHSKWVNYISSSSLAVYLITDNQHVRGGISWLTHNIFCNIPDTILYVPLYITVLALIFLICIVIDKIRAFMINPVDNIIYKLIEKHNLDIEISF